VEVLLAKGQMYDQLQARADDLVSLGHPAMQVT
jgi:hypothetical protein